MQVSVRQSRADELAWANARYAEIDFLASEAGDYLAVAEADGVPAGLGRVVRLGDDVGELGGMLVFDGFRGGGVAGAIIAHLLNHAGLRRLYCLPFASLRPLYEKAGFTLDTNADAGADADAVPIPEQIRRKHAWCNSRYLEPVLLMYRQAVNTTTC